ncbi:hypothetical protein [Patulibacter americanus]|uniref:hypothetical protein n=1 Tax=Patulibacter americanus TaxID=588672 RepID=UPI0003B63932|nr:hypothetical protein [Patulibacter americanus]
MSRLSRSRGPAASSLLVGGRAVPLALAALLAGAAPAAADVARMAVDEPNDPRQPSTVRITVTDGAGAERRLGPFTTVEAPSGLVASPDGRHLLVLPSDDGNGEGRAYVVASAGGPLVPLTMPTNVAAAPPYSELSWTPDGSEVIIGDAARSTPRPDDADETTLTWTALRCPVASAVCAELPGPAGSAVGVPGGALVSSSPFSLFPAEYLFAGISDTPRPDWVRPGGADGRLVRNLHGATRVSATHIEGVVPRTVGRFVGRAADGLPYTLGLTGGPSGALALRYTLTTRVRRRADGRIRLAQRGSGPRLLTVAPNGEARTGPAPRVRIPRRDLDGTARKRIRGVPRWPFVPRLGRSDGGWVGFAFEDPASLAPDGVLATMGDDGRPRAVQVGGRSATARNLIEALPDAGSFDYASEFRVLGYERASRSAVVRVDWSSGEGRSRTRRVAMRVPLDGGGTPRTIPGGADAAW